MIARDPLLGPGRALISASGSYRICVAAKRASDGTITTFDAPGAYISLGFGTQPTDINADGVVVGNVLAIAAPTDYQSFVRDAAGNFSVFNPPGVGPDGSTASGISESGVVVGSFTDPYTRHGYIHNSDGNIVVIDDPQAAAVETVVNGINSAGAVVGFWFDSARAWHGFARK